MGAGTHLELLKDSKEARAAEQNEPSREEQERGSENNHSQNMEGTYRPDVGQKRNKGQG